MKLIPSLLLLPALGAAAALVAQTPTPAPTPPAPPPAAAAAQGGSPLPPGPGHDTMVRVCSGCHAPDIAAQQRLTPDGWHELVEMMANNGAVATDAELAEITVYLTRSFPADQLPGR
ncbi:hypothetical protein [Sphingomonas quercus]|uniref:Cytochrome c domain-containing protein n=1 Tax=Sphingomonas quercus TaxID=2842451 RepID=A0ABS6BLX1_9SPHN|nr:hypothetical protein [Sphingomonas quercus]MBU3079306.1 hypothetical protein [Sphingomonas quercus]